MNAEQLTKNLRAWAAKFDAISLRERAMSLAMVMAVLWTGVNTLLLEPALQRKAAAQQNLNASETLAAALQAQLDAFAVQTPADPNAALRERSVLLRARLAESDAQLRDFGQGLVSPAEMPELLEKLLAGTAGPKLEAFRKLPAADVLAPVPSRAEGPGAPAKPNVLSVIGGVAGAESAPPSPEGQPAAGKAQDTPRQDAGQVYRHGVELTLSGGYADLLAWLDAVENMPWKVLWGEVRLSTDQHPRLRMRLTLYTLSLERDWLVL